MMKFNLQLFGKGGSKAVGKLLAGIIGFILGGWAGAIMGISLFASIWGNKRQQQDTSSVNRFDRYQETMTSGGAIQVVYGCRKINGNQTYHETNADANTLHKHVVLCEGDIQGIANICANGLIIPSLGQESSVVMTIQNTKWEDAKVYTNGNSIWLYWNFTIYKEIPLPSKDDIQTSGDTYWEWQVSIAGLIAYINRLGEGWEAFPTASTSKYPSEMTLVNQHKKCYLSPAKFTCEVVRGGTEYTFHDGDLPDNYEQVGSYSNMAWLDMHFIVSNELNGNPSVDAIIEGKKVYDTRVQETIYSTNPAMCLRDFLLSERYGLGKWISQEDLDEDSFIDAADYCDEVIYFPRNDGSVVSKKRFELNMVIDSQQRAWDWVDSMLGCFQAYISINQGKIQLFIERPSPIVYKFDESNIFDIKVASTPLEETPNQYKIKFVDPKNDWKTVTAEVNDYADQKERGKIVTKEVELEGVTSQDQALRLGRFYRDYNFVSSFVVTFKTGTQAIGLSCGDVIQITYKKVFVDMPFRISQMKETVENEVEIECRPYNESIYNDSLGASLIAYNYSQMEIRRGDIPVPTNLKAKQDYYLDKNGVVHSTYDLNWDSVKYTHPITYRIHVYSETDTWDFVGETPELKWAGTAIVGDTYKFAIYAVSGDKQSEYGFFPELTITGIDEPPNPVENLKASYNGSIRVSWDVPDDVDISHYEITANGNLIISYETNIYIEPINGSNSISVVAVDNAGNKSQSRTTNIYCELIPDKVTNFKATNEGGYIILTWDKSNRALGYLLEGSASATIYGNTYFIPATKIGNFTYTIRATNEYGESEPTTVKLEVTDINTVEPVLEIDLFEYANTYTGAVAEYDSEGNMYIIKLEE